MTRQCRAYALTEVLVIIAILVTVVSLSAKPLRTLLSEIPRSAQTYQTQKITIDALKQLKEDIERAGRIVQLEKNILTLEHNANPVVYTLTDGQISRRPALNSGEDATEWQLPNVMVRPRLWSRNNEFYAVEMTVWTRQKVLGAEDDNRFRQTAVFFQKGTQR